MIFRHATTSLLALSFSAFDRLPCLPLQVKWRSTRDDRKKGEETRGQKEQRPGQGRRSTGEGKGQGQRGRRGHNRRQGKEGRGPLGADEGHRQGQAGQGQGPTQVALLVIRGQEELSGGLESWLSTLQLVINTHPRSKRGDARFRGSDGVWLPLRRLVGAF